MSNKTTSTTSQTDWHKVDALKDEDIDLSDNPEVTPAMFANGIVRKGLKLLPGKQQVTLHIDADVLARFKSHGKGSKQKLTRCSGNT